MKLGIIPSVETRLGPYKPKRMPLVLITWTKKYSKEAIFARVMQSKI